LNVESTRPGVTLIDAGELDSGLDGGRVWMACTCGAVINRCADDD